MKMPRSQSETENVQFVQELAEVDGPFEAPININFRDLTKLELPSLVWNRGETSPKKMKITNTGHTVIISGKWKSERPYLTGGPLLGKYVFSQIHFHWGQDDFKGSEHQVCGEGFPLEMHVAHFKTEYMTQESALREKDGMVVVVYLFKLQEEPNSSLKKIINSLPSVKQPSTSHAIDPRPILSLCNPFTDDYFMYWGSVVTSTCAHILLWIICREPFGISREQVNEFRKIMDSSQQPICRNNRDIQPLHKRNVFHVNASKHLDESLLPIKKILGCYCKGSEENVKVKHSNECNCQGSMPNQEDVEGIFVESTTVNQCSNIGGIQFPHLRESLPSNCFPNQTFFVHTATVQSVSIMLKRSGSDPIRNHCCLDNLKKIKSEGNNKQVKLVSQSCCFLPVKDVQKIKNLADKNNARVTKRPFNSLKAFSQIMHSLEALKNHTFKKLKEIESINQEIKEMKPFCQDTEDKRWLHKIEKMMTKQKRFTIKSSQGCLSELKKLAKECNFDKFFDAKALPVGDQKMVWLTNEEITGENPPCFEDMKEEEIPGVANQSSKNLDINKAIQFSAEAQKLIQSFFEDIKDSDDLKDTVKKDLSLKKIKSYCSKQGDSNSVFGETKNFITPKMFVLGNLGDRFFTEVTTDDFKVEEKQSKDGTQTEELTLSKEASETKSVSERFDNEKNTEIDEPDIEKNIDANLMPKIDEVIPLHRANIAILLSNTNIEKKEETEDSSSSEDEKQIPCLQNSSETDKMSKDNKKPIPSPKTILDKAQVKKSVSASSKELSELTNEKMMKTLEAKVELSNIQHSSSNLSTESTETQSMIIAKFRQSRKDFWEQKRKKSPGILKISSKGLYNKASCKKFEGYYIQKKNLKNKKRQSRKEEKEKQQSSYGLSSTSKEETNTSVYKSKWQRVTKAKFKIEIEKTSDTSTDSAIENSVISPERKKLKLECKKLRTYSSRESTLPSEANNKNAVQLTDTETRTIILKQSVRHQENEFAQEKKENLAEKDSEIYEKNSSEKQRNIIPESTENDLRNESRTSTNRTFRASSADSKTSYTIGQEPKKSENCDLSLQAKSKTLSRETPKLAGTKPVSRSRSLINLTITPRISTEFTQRIYLESIDDRRKSNKDASVQRKSLESPDKLEEKNKIASAKDLSPATSGENFKKPYEEQDLPETHRTTENKEKCDPQIQNKLEYNIGFFTTTSSQVDDELLPKSQVQEKKCKSTVLKRCDSGKYQFLEKGPCNFNSGFQEPGEDHPEILHRTDSNKSFVKDVSKGDAEVLVVDNKDLQTSLSCSTLKKNSTSRPHSAETLHSVTKTFKRKGKKRPHCCKRNSRHYIKKNSSIFKKPNKTESKPLNFLSLTDEEQLKIISVNVAKYLKQKMVEGNSVFDPKKKCSFNDIEEVFTNLKASQQKLGETSEQVPCTVKQVETKDETLAVKAKERKDEKEKRAGSAKIPRAIKSPSEPKKEKSAFISPKPVNNFIKLNKQMAGKYKRLAPQVEKKLESKEKEKQEPDRETETKNETTEPTNEKTTVKTKLLKKKKEKLSAQKAKQPVNSRPETATSQKSQKVSPKGNPLKENQTKSSAASKRPASDAKKNRKASAPAEVAEETEQLTNCEPNPEETLPSVTALQKIPQAKKCFVPTYMLTSYLPAPIEIVESQKKKMSRCLLGVNNSNMDTFQQELLYDTKTKIQEGSKSETLFKKELEYFIKLQMCLNNELSTNIENSMNYVKSRLLSQECNGTNFKENLSLNDTLQYLDCCNKKVLVMETKDILECSSSCSEFAEDPAKCNLERDAKDNSNEDNSKKKATVTIKTPKESGDPGIADPASAHEGQEESQSDSSYDCKISITLNTNPNAKEGEGGVQSYDPYNCLGENSNNSQTTTCLEGSSSQSTVMKPNRKKRKESDIPVEMKQKLLEILEGEIKREAGIACGGSSENSSDGLTFKWEDSDGNNRSQSTESSCDNMEVLAQISNTMRQYLTYLKDMRQLSDKERKEYDES